MSRRIKLSVSVLSFVFACVLGLGIFSACSQTDNTKSSSTGTPIMPISHEGRYDALGAKGCYGCHGSSADTDVFLSRATPLPESHYKDESVETHELSSGYLLCITCHAQEQK